MAVEHTAQHRPATTVRRAQPANAPAAAARAVSPAAKLQQRLGARAAQAFVSKPAEVAPHAAIAPHEKWRRAQRLHPRSRCSRTRARSAAHAAARAPSAGASASAATSRRFAGAGARAPTPPRGPTSRRPAAAAHHAAEPKAAHGTHAAEGAGTSGAHAKATTAQAHAALGPLTHAVHQRAQFARRNTETKRCGARVGCSATRCETSEHRGRTRCRG